MHKSICLRPVTHTSELFLYSHSALNPQLSTYSTLCTQFSALSSTFSSQKHKMKFLVLFLAVLVSAEKQVTDSGLEIEFLSKPYACDRVARNGDMLEMHYPRGRQEVRQHPGPLRALQVPDRRGAGDQGFGGGRDGHVCW